MLKHCQVILALCLLCHCSKDEPTPDTFLADDNAIPEEEESASEGAGTGQSAEAADDELAELGGEAKDAVEETSELKGMRDESREGETPKGGRAGAGGGRPPQAAPVAQSPRPSGPASASPVPAGSLPEGTVTIGFNVGNYLFVKSDGANLRQGPSIDTPVVGTLKNNEKVQVLERQGKWIRVNKERWVSQKALTAYHKVFKIKNKSTQVRSAPFHNAKVVVTLDKGVEVEVQEVLGTWVKIGSYRFIPRQALEQ